jgi:AraC-like DNA-binding protein
MPAVPNNTTVEAGDSFEHWHQVTCRDYGLSEFHHTSDNSFRARISSGSFSALALTEASSNSGAARLIRDSGDIRKDPRDHFMLFLVTHGGIGVAQDGREAPAKSGDFFVYDEAKPLTLEFKAQYRTVMLNIPRSLLEARIPQVRAFTACCISGSSKLGALAGSVVRQLIGFDVNTELEVLNRVSGSTLDIIATALERESPGEALTRLGGHRLLSKVERYLLANLHNSKLDIDTIATDLSISPRTLNRLFALNGTTPMRWLWKQRLIASNRALVEGRLANVTDVALNFGFSDVSHFSRAFKMAFGKTPSAVKRR